MVINREQKHQYYCEPTSFNQKNQPISFCYKFHKLALALIFIILFMA